MTKDLEFPNATLVDESDFWTDEAELPYFTNEDLANRAKFGEGSKYGN